MRVGGCFKFNCYVYIGSFLKCGFYVLDIRFYIEGKLYKLYSNNRVWVFEINF